MKVKRLTVKAAQAAHESAVVVLYRFSHWPSAEFRPVSEAQEAAPIRLYGKYGKGTRFAHVGKPTFYVEVE